MATGFSTRSGPDGYRLNFDTDNLDYYLLMQKIARHCVDGKPAADVVEVRHGRWVDENKNPIPWDECNSKCPSHSAYCSGCGEWLTASDEYPVTGLYCPNCGARMGKEADHAQT